MHLTNRKIIKITFSLVFISIILSTVVSIYSLNRMADDNQKEINMLLAARIHDTINGELTKPVMVAKTMANNRFLLDFLQSEENPADASADIANMQDYLSRLKAKLGYDAAFVISDHTKRYYTGDGLNKIIDVENDPHDIWYSTFVDKDKEYDLDVDIDEVNGDIWTVFVNARIDNEDGLLGVCGVGVRMDSIQDLIASYEKQYEVKINLIDSNGLVQVDTNEINIENAYLNDVNISAEDSNEYVYQDGSNGEYIVSKYIENLGWFLVVQSEDRVIDRALMRVILLNAALFALVALVFLISSLIMQRHTHMLMKSSYLDELTKIRNRRAYEEELAQLAKDPLPPHFVYVNIDVNGLKTANDTFGHAAGDELIRAAAECLQDTLGKYGHVFRIGGDEFAALLSVLPEEFERVKDSLQERLKKWKGAWIDEVSLSVGYVPRWEASELTIDEIIQEADKRMYAVKEEFYKTSGQKKR